MLRALEPEWTPLFPSRVVPVLATGSPLGGAGVSPIHHLSPANFWRCRICHGTTISPCLPSFTLLLPGLAESKDELHKFNMQLLASSATCIYLLGRSNIIQPGHAGGKPEDPSLCSPVPSPPIASLAASLQAPWPMTHPSLTISSPRCHRHPDSSHCHILPGAQEAPNGCV